MNDTEAEELGKVASGKTFTFRKIKDNGMSINHNLHHHHHYYHDC